MCKMDYIRFCVYVCGCLNSALVGNTLDGVWESKNLYSNP
jgi:hypothetical protein